MCGSRRAPELRNVGPFALSWFRTFHPATWLVTLGVTGLLAGANFAGPPATTFEYSRGWPFELYGGTEARVVRMYQASDGSWVTDSPRQLVVWAAQANLLVAALLVLAAGAAAEWTARVAQSRPGLLVGTVCVLGVSAIIVCNLPLLFMSPGLEIAMLIHRVMPGWVSVVAYSEVAALSAFLLAISIAPGVKHPSTGYILPALGLVVSSLYWAQLVAMQQMDFVYPFSWFGKLNRSSVLVVYLSVCGFRAFRGEFAAGGAQMKRSLLMGAFTISLAIFVPFFWVPSENLTTGGYVLWITIAGAPFFALWGTGILAARGRVSGGLQL